MTPPDPSLGGFYFALIKNFQSLVTFFRGNFMTRQWPQSCSPCDSVSNGNNFDPIWAFFRKYFWPPPDPSHGGFYFALIKNFQSRVTFFRGNFMTRQWPQSCSPCDYASNGGNFDLIRAFFKKYFWPLPLDLSPTPLRRFLFCTNKKVSKSCNFFQRQFHDSSVTTKLFALRLRVEWW